MKVLAIVMVLVMFAVPVMGASARGLNTYNAVNNYTLTSLKAEYSDEEAVADIIVGGIAILFMVWGFCQGNAYGMVTGIMFGFQGFGFIKGVGQLAGFR